MNAGTWKMEAIIVVSVPVVVALVVFQKLFAVFPRASDALGAAVTAQRALATYAWPEAVVVRVRMGLHTGAPARLAEGYVGPDLHYAARIMSAAHFGLDHGIGHSRVSAVDGRVRAAAPPMPKSRETSTVASARKTAPLQWFRQAA